MNMAAGDAVEGVRLGARPTAQVEPSRNALLLPVEMFEQGHELIALDQKSGRIRYQQRANCLVARIIRAVSNGLWFLRSGAESERILFLRLLDRVLERGDVAE